ncbi:helix-turn-helix domain-containing protein [Glaesserella parasuis]|uniref:helix-turn-helix domain-containing protein n=1 Tax=Glaesserella parasuis TaxID=738 RepID=UPI0003AC376F|nr:helix-turn-helix domain-containing protein [Glaesserella parasuis]ATW43456.1 hypothetical protein A2U20_06450 [Glaesserella parasuis D74]EQA10940.1 hypothetical protein HPSD74_0642 [Glaesserella parasuis D74]MDD2171706.1 helix-turn-helix domain-containing protein [Glaesserella parasuis]MDO9830563.1 helix-turn-helix domain-containing protein [Glaesserella parasuis]MDP0119045.1 helix-turn-helix domain-containing protein [Glaesserella parasuis]
MNVKFGQRLREERTRLGYSQTALVEICEISYNAYSNYELGKRFPSADLLMKLGTLGFDIVYLLQGLKNAYAPEIKERMLLKTFRELSETQQKDIIEQINTLEMGRHWQITDLNKPSSVSQTITNSTVENIAGGNITVNKG